VGSFEIKVAAADSRNNEGKRGFVSFKKVEKVHLPYSLEAGFPAVYSGPLELQEEIPAAAFLCC